MSTSRLSLAFRDLQDIPEKIRQQYSHVRELDLSNNRLTDLSSLSSFTALETLVLDKNRIPSNIKLPLLPNLTTLWVNHNDISNLAIFLDRLVETAPNLKYLSMLGNTACPNYLNGGTLGQYKDYRYYIVNRLRNLSSLDSTNVTEEERRKALRIYGPLGTSVAKDIVELEKQRDLERQQEIERREKEKEEAARRREEIKRKRMEKLERQKKRREEQRKRREEAKEQEEARKKAERQGSSSSSSTPNKAGGSQSGLPQLPDLDSITSPSKLVDFGDDDYDLTDDEDWSSDSDLDTTEKTVYPSTATVDGLTMESLPAINKEEEEEWDD